MQKKNEKKKRKGNENIQITTKRYFSFDPNVNHEIDLLTKKNIRDVILFGTDHERRSNLS